MCLLPANNFFRTKNCHSYIFLSVYATLQYLTIIAKYNFEILGIITSYTLNFHFWILDLEPSKQTKIKLTLPNQSPILIN